MVIVPQDALTYYFDAYAQVQSICNGHHVNGANDSTTSFVPCEGRSWSRAAVESGQSFTWFEQHYYWERNNNLGPNHKNFSDAENAYWAQMGGYKPIDGVWTCLDSLPEMDGYIPFLVIITLLVSFMKTLFATKFYRS